MTSRDEIRKLLRSGPGPWMQKAYTQPEDVPFAAAASNRQPEPGELVRIVRAAVNELRTNHLEQRFLPCGCVVCTYQRDDLDAIEGLMPPWWIAEARANPDG